MITDLNKYTIIEGTTYGKVRYLCTGEGLVLQQEVTEKYKTYENGEIISYGYRSRFENIPHE